MLQAPGEFVTIANEDTRPFTYRCLGQTFTLEPGQRRIVPWMHLCHLLGDPFLTNATKEREREREYERIWALHGRDTTPAQWPKLAAYDSDGERITTIVDDREGTSALTAPSDDIDPSALRSQLDQMERRMQQLTQLLDVQNARTAPQAGLATPDRPPSPPAAEAPDLPADVITEVAPGLVPQPDAPEDKPTKTPVRGGRK